MKTFLVQIYFRLVRLYWKIAKPVTLGARALVVRNEKVLLVQLTYYPGWLLPGGGVDRGESFEEAARRELKEECGLEAKEAQLFGIYIKRNEGKIDHVAVYNVTDFSGEVGVSHPAEIKAAQFFPLQQLPEGLHPGHRRRIEEYLGRRDKELTW